MTGRQHLPKDFFIINGINQQQRGVWLSPVGDHPVVWVKGEVELAAGAAQSDAKPVTPLQWDKHHNVMFSELVEAFTGRRTTPQQWMQMIREAVVIVNREFRNQLETETKDDRETIRQLKRVVQGKGWKVRDKVQQSLTDKYWETTVQQWRQVSQPGMAGRTLKVLRLKAANPFKILHQVEDTDRQCTVEGKEILTVVSKECLKKYPVHTTRVPVEWVEGLVGKHVTDERPQRVERAAELIIRKGAGPVSISALVHRKGEMVNKTAGVDGFTPAFVKLFGIQAAHRFIEILRMGYEQWPEEVKEVLHMTAHKSKGCNVNKNTRPIKMLSALLRIQARLLGPLVQTMTRPRWSAGRQFAGYKGSSVHGMRRLMHMLITQALATKGAVGVLLLDIVGAFDEVMGQSITVMAQQGTPDVRDTVNGVLKLYEHLRTYVVTAYGLSKWYKQIDGVLQGGGLDPLLYIIPMHLLHLAVREAGVGVRLRVILGEETVDSMGYVDDTAAAAAAPAKDVAEITQHLADTLRRAIHTLGQRNHSGKMKVLGFKVENGNIAVHKFKVKWGADKVTTENRHADIKLLGGNVNITGGYAAIRKVIKTWTNRVIGQLARWPVSAGVTIAVIEGLVENHMVYKCVVNIPTEGQISELTGMVTRAFRGAFGIPRRTPRECVYDIIGRPGPDTLMWVTAIVEYHKAMNSPSEVLNETTWVHWQSEDLHRWDKDVRRLRARVHNMGIKFIRVESQQGEVWTLQRPEENTAVRVLYIFGDASNIEQWGGAAMVVVKKAKCG